MKRRPAARATSLRSRRTPAAPRAVAAPSALVTLVTETSPTGPGVTAPLSFGLLPDGRPAPFAIPAGMVLVVTEVLAMTPRGNAPAGRYVAAICNGPCFFSRIPIYLSTAVDGVQKQMTFSAGVVFSSLPQFQTLPANPSDMSVQVYGYLARRS
jgi:hypothetical protein